MAGAGIENKIIFSQGEKLFPSTATDISNMQETATDVSRVNFTGDPNGNVAANPSSLCHDPVSGNVYFKQTGTGNTGWIQIADLHTARFIVGDTSNGANYTTIASAITAASSGDSIFIQDGTYTENLSVGKNLNFFSFSPELRSDNQNAIFVGKITVSGSNLKVGFFGFKFTTNSDNSFLLSGSGSSITTQNCYFNATNANSISGTGTDSNFYVTACSGNFASTFTLYVSTNTIMWINNCYFYDATTPGTSTISAAPAYINNSWINFPLSTSATGAIQATLCRFGTVFTPFINTTWITTAGTVESDLLHCEFYSGTASCISVGSGTIVNAHQCIANSSNANVITGAGTFNYSNISYTGTSTTINPTTPVIVPSSDFQKINIQTFTVGSSTYTPTAGMKYCIVECIGAGGGGGGTATTGATQMAVGAGGGGGGYSRSVLTAATVGASKTVVVGAGGAGGIGNNPGAVGNDTTFNTTTIVAKGGSGGSAGTASTGSSVSSGGAGGIVGTGNVSNTGGIGGAGFCSLVASTGVAMSGVGGSSHIGGGARSTNIFNGSANVIGVAGSNFGSGGSGGATGLNQGTGATGGVGADGYCIITEFI